jgi:hypothetical protein
MSRKKKKKRDGRPLKVEPKPKDEQTLELHRVLEGAGKIGPSGEVDIKELRWEAARLGIKIESDKADALWRKRIKDLHTVILRGRGPAGAPGTVAWQVTRHRGTTMGGRASLIADTTVREGLPANAGLLEFLGW